MVFVWKMRWKRYIYLLKYRRGGSMEESTKLFDYNEIEAENIKEKAEELYKYAIEKGTPVVEKAADDVRKQALKIVREAEKKLVEANKN